MVIGKLAFPIIMSAEPFATIMRVFLIQSKCLPEAFNNLYQANFRRTTREDPLPISGSNGTDSIATATWILLATADVSTIAQIRYATDIHSSIVLILGYV